LNDDGSINIDNVKKFINPKEETKQQYLLKNNDIVIARSGSVGKSAIFKKEKYEDMVFASYLIRLQVKDNKILPDYLFYFTKTQMYWKQVEENSIAVTQPNLNAEKIKGFQIPLPPIKIQEKIVVEIETFVKKETMVREKVESLEKSVFAIIENVKGEKTKLFDITTKIGSGATPFGGEGVYKSSGITFIRSQNVYDGLFIEDGLAYIDEEQAKKLDGVTVEKNDILFNITGASIARCCIVENKYLPARVNQHVSIIRTNKNVLPKYVQLTLISKEIKNKLLQIGEGATSRQAITKSQLENFEIPLPSISEQQNIVSKIEELEAQILDMQKELEQLSNQKELVLKKYL